MKQVIFKYIPIWVIYKIRYIVEYLSGYVITKRELGYKEINKRKVFIIDLPEHGNLGDQAIALSEVSFLEKYYNPECDELYFWYLEDFVKHWLWLKKNIKRNDIILCHGGGNIGDVYPRAEYIRQIVIHEFPNNKIIIFPQTCYFTNSVFGNVIRKRSESVYSNHSNLVICAREEKSYSILREMCPQNNILIVPDMVLGYPREFKRPTKGVTSDIVVTFCMRNDSEKVISAEMLTCLQKVCEKKGFIIKKTDTVVNRKLKNIFEARETVEEKIDELAKSDLVITDRLHGMVLTALSGTRCIVISNNNHKVYGVYKWIESMANVLYLHNANEFERTVDKLMKDNSAEFPNLSDKYEILRCEIFGVNNEK